MLNPRRCKDSAYISAGALVGTGAVWLGCPVRVAFAAAGILLAWYLMMYAIAVGPTGADGREG